MVMILSLLKGCEEIQGIVNPMLIDLFYGITYACYVGRLLFIWIVTDLALHILWNTSKPLCWC